MTDELFYASRAGEDPDPPLPDTPDKDYDNGYSDYPHAAVVLAASATTASATRSGGHAAPVLSFTHVQKTATINCGGCFHVMCDRCCHNLRELCGQEVFQIEG